MARDRQRARQRRSRQPGAGGPAAGSARTNARDIGLEPTDTDLGGTTPAPEPTKHAFPDVEQARMTEAGTPAPDVGEEFPPRRIAAPDAAEHQDAPATSRAAREGHGAERGRLLTFLGHVVDELRRVQWPDRRQVGQGTLVTLVFVLVAGGYLGLLDAIWKPLIEAIL